MVKTFTQDDVIRYSYNEMEATERMAFEVELVNNPELADMLESTEESKANLDAAVYSPRHTVVDQVLKYSSHTAPLEHSL